MDKETFAQKIVDNYDMETLIDTAVFGILESWKNKPELLEEEIKQRQDILNNEKVE